MNQLQYILLVFCCELLFGKPVMGQDKKTQDSLFAIAFKKQPDTNSVKAFQAIQRNFFNAGLYDSTFEYAHLVIDLAKKIDDKKGLAKSYYNMGMICTNLTKYDSAKHYTELAEREALLLGDSLLLVNCYNAFAIQYRYQSDYNTSLTYALKGAAIAERSADSVIIKMIPKLYSNIGSNLISENQLLKAIEYEKNALLFTNYIDEQRYRISLQLDIADAYTKLKNYSVAKKYLDSAVAANKLFNNIILDLLTANTEGFYYDNTGNYAAATAAYRLSYKYSDSSHNDYLKAEAADNLSIILLKQEKYSEALPFATEGNAISIRLKHFNVAASTFSTLKDIAIAKGDDKVALRYAKLNKLYADSATNEATQKTTLSLDAKYQSQKKEKEIADLTIANKEKELTVVKRNRLLIVGSISAAGLLLTLSLFYRNSKQKQLLTAKENILQQEQIKFLERQQQVVSLQSMVNGQETERTRIAKDLHDGLGGLFSTVKMYFSTLQHEQEYLKSNTLFSKSYELIGTASEEVRRIAHNMMPEVLMKLGLVPALQDMCSNISAGKLLQVKLQSYGMEKRMNASTEIMLYRIVQELLNNIIKHAQASEAIIQFNRDADRLTVTVEDNGRGFNLQETDDKKHAGLDTIKSRVSYLNGNISIDSQQEIGTTVMMEFLLNQE
ncbi:MAG: ATP-binding protein [Chitinophagaceae bacterium]